MLMAVVHIIGTLLTLTVFFFATVSLEAYRSRRRLEGVLETAALRLGLSRERVCDGAHEDQVIRYLADTYGTKHIANRFSDLCRPLTVTLEVLSYFSQITIVAFAVWITFTEGFSYTPVAWIALIVAACFWGLIMLTSAICYLVTGRRPGEARDARELVNNWARNN